MTTITIPRETFDQMQRALDLVYSKLSGNVNGADEHCFTISMKNQISYTQMCRISDALSAAKAVQPQAKGSYQRGYGVALSDAEEAIDDECRERVVTASDCIEILRNLGKDEITHPQASEPACDRAYLNGLRAGFGYGISGDEAGYQKSANSYRAMLAAAPEATK